MNDEEILQLAEVILREEEEFLFPVLKLYKLMEEEKDVLDFELEHLISLLNSDEKFYLLDSKSTLEPWPDEYDNEMRKLGYFKGPRIMLKEKAPSKQEMMQAITEKMQTTLSSMKNAYQVRPDDLDDEDEEQFLEVMKKVKNLEKKIGNSFENDKENEQ